MSGLLTAVLPVSLEVSTTILDVYSYLMRTGYGTVSNTGDGTDDGVHYTPKTYKRIFTFCLNNIRKTENYFNIEDVGS